MATCVRNGVTYEYPDGLSQSDWIMGVGFIELHNPKPTPEMRHRITLCRNNLTLWALGAGRLSLIEAREHILELDGLLQQMEL